MARSSEVEITYTPRLGISDEDEIRVLASVYSFVLRAGQQRNRGKEGGPPTAPDDRKGFEHDPATVIIPGE